MSPKAATTSFFALLSITLTLTLSLAAAAEHNGCPGNSVSEVLGHYDLPTGLFPDYVKDFSCHPVHGNEDPNALKLSIDLEGACNVTKAWLKIVGNLVMCQPHISAVISDGHLTHINGVTVTLTYNNKPAGDLMTITEVKVTTKLFIKWLQFNSDIGPSPWFPFADIANEPPKCDKPPHAFDYIGSDGIVVAKNNNQDVPIWVYKYGRLLPLVIA